MTQANYEAEAVTTNSDWLKLTPGQHKITFLEEIPAPTKVTKTINGKEETLEQSVVLVDCNQKTAKWSIRKGISSRSTWKQLMKYAAKEKTVIGKTVTAIVKADGNKKDITILEAL